MLREDQVKASTTNKEAVEERTTIKELREEDLDFLPAQLTQTELEALMVLLDNKTPMTSKAVEKRVQLAHIISFLEQFSNTRDRKILEKRFSDSELKPSQKKFSSLAINTLMDLATEWPKVRGVSGFQVISKHLNSIREKTGKKISLEELRISWLSVLNEFFGAEIPSGKKVNSSLERLRTQIRCITKEKMKISTTSTSAWVLNTEFLRVWNKRRAELVADHDAHFDKERSIEKQKEWDYYDLENPTMRYIEAKYSPLVLDFYLFPYPTGFMKRKHEIPYIAYAKEVKELV